MRVLVLIIASDDNDVYKAEQNLWRTYMKKHPDVECYFIKSSGTDIQMSEDTLFVPGREGFDTIKHKTIEAIRYFLTRDTTFTHVLRTNLSSFFVWERVISKLQSLPSTNLYAGIKGEYYGSFYASGAAFFMSRDVCSTLVATPFPNYTGIDDVDIGYFLHHVNGYSITEFEETNDRSMNDHLDNETAFHYRLKIWPRDTEGMEKEINTMRQMIEKYYP